MSSAWAAAVILLCVWLDSHVVAVSSPRNMPKCLERAAYESQEQAYDFGTGHAPTHPVCPDTRVLKAKATPGEGCCNGEYDGACNETDSCLCDEYEYPVRFIVNENRKSTAGQVYAYTPREARHLLHMKRLFFVGDSTTRRLMYAFCSFLGEKIWQDRHGAHHDSLKCPEDGWEDNLVNDAMIDLHFKWAPKLLDLTEQMQQIKKDSHEWDYVITSIYHVDRLHGGHKVGILATDLVDAMHDLVKNPRGGPSKTRAIIVAPNLVAAHQGRNTAILNFGAQLMDATAASRDVVAVSNRWMKASHDDDERHHCLGDTVNTGIHVKYELGQIMRVHSVLSKIAAMGES